ncbi:helix-turn-helix transcriptional regulator [Mesorhizobium sp. M1348]|uniref:helix-turn-helix domain-containing protein n=1 Tax=unclassified Mesorhizobium TaxID=325217 RepID=UPI0033366F57
MFDTIYEEIGATIRELRESKLKISQEEMAKRVGISRPSVANIERGGQQLTVGQLLLFSNVLGVHALALLPSEYGSNETGSLVDALPGDVDPKLRAWVGTLQG